MAEDCLFCKIAASKIPAAEVSSNEEFFAFRDISPAAPIHILVIPRKHIPRITDATEEHVALLGRMVLFANSIAKSEGIEEGFRYVWNCGPGGGQTVFHIHLHILGGRDMTWPPG